MSDGLEGMWKEGAVASFKVLSRSLPEEIEKICEKPQPG
jgi:hypothetical protein